MGRLAQTLGLMNTILPHPTLEDLRGAAAALQASLPDRLHAASLTPNSKLPFKVLSLREVVIHRMAALSTSTVHLLDANQPVAAAILTRAAIETTALLHSLRCAITTFIENKDTRTLDEFLMKGLVGSRWKDAKVQATSVLTLINRLDREMPGFREMYDDLCEYAHPNWSGLMGSFSARKDGDYEVSFGPSQSTDAQGSAIALLFIALHTFRHLYNDMISDLRVLNAHFDAPKR